MSRTHRKESIAELLREEVAKLVHEEFNPPEGAVVTITRVEVADDLDTALIYATVLPDELEGETMEHLIKFAGEVQYGLLKHLRIRPIPRISFVTDSGQRNADIVDEALYRLKDDK
jgi:ribosome-binding factor A